MSDNVATSARALAYGAVKARMRLGPEHVDDADLLIAMAVGWAIGETLDPERTGARLVALQHELTISSPPAFATRFNEALRLARRIVADRKSFVVS